MNEDSGMQIIILIEIHKPEGVQKGVLWMEVEGQKITGNQIALIPGKKEYHVIVQMG